MKVLYFTRDYSPHDERFLTALGTSGHEIFLLRLEPSQPVQLPAGISEVKTSTEGTGPLVTPAEQVGKLKQVIHSIKPDVIHAGPLHGPAHIAALSGFPRLVSMSWGADILHDGEVDSDARVKIQHALDYSAVFVCDCLAVADKATREYNFPSERIYRFPWGVDLAHFTPQGGAGLREKLGWKDNFVFLSNRSFEPIYGVDVTLRAFIKATESNPEIRLLLYGKGSQEQILRSMVEKAGVTDKVHFGGYVSRDELPYTYRSADIFLSASHCDGSSVSLLEALACGLPGIVSDIPGNREWVSSGEQGWVFHDGDADEMSALMHTARHEPALVEYAARARAMAEQKADWRSNFPVLLQAYEAANSQQNRVSGIKTGTE